MFTLVTDTGRAAIGLTRSTPDKIVFTGFDIGRITPELLPDLTGKPYDFQTSAYPLLQSSAWITENFGVLYHGEPSDMYWTPVGSRDSILRCEVPSDTEYFRFNAVRLTYQIGTVSGIFLLSYYTAVNPKLSLEINAGGMKYYWSLNLKADAKDDKFDFSNLNTRAPDFFTVDTYAQLPPAHQEPRNQGILKQHPLDTNDRLLLISSQGQWLAAPCSEIDPEEFRDSVIFTGSSDDQLNQGDFE